MVGENRRYAEVAGSAGETNNGAWRSTSIDTEVDRAWLEQPDPDHPSTVFGVPWVKPVDDGHVYFGFAEYDAETEEASRKPNRFEIEKLEL